MSKKIAVVGLGNILLKDEGLGVHIIKELEKRPLAEDIELFDAGTASLDALGQLKGLDKLIIVDSVTYGQAPGSVYCFRPEDLSAEQAQQAFSLHQMGVLESLSVVKRLGNLPAEIVIIGVEPKKIDWGLDLSPEVKQKVPEVLNLIFKELAREKVGDKS